MFELKSNLRMFDGNINIKKNWGVKKKKKQTKERTTDQTNKINLLSVQAHYIISNSS